MQPHAKRPVVDEHEPVHVTMRVVRGPDLRKRDIYKALHWAIAIA